MPGLTFSNELILRDVGLHAEFSCLVYSMLQNKLPDSVVHDIVREAITAERQFICEALPCVLIPCCRGRVRKFLLFLLSKTAMFKFSYVCAYLNSQTPCLHSV